MAEKESPLLPLLSEKPQEEKKKKEPDNFWSIMIGVVFWIVACGIIGYLTGRAIKREHECNEMGLYRYAAPNRQQTGEFEMAVRMHNRQKVRMNKLESKFERLRQHIQTKEIMDTPIASFSDIYAKARLEYLEEEKEEYEPLGN